MRVYLATVILILSAFLLGINSCQNSKPDPDCIRCIEQQDEISALADSVIMALDSANVEFVKLGKYTFEQDSIISELNADIFNTQASLKRIIYERDYQIDQLQKLRRVDNITLENLRNNNKKKDQLINKQDSLYVYLEGSFIDSTSHLKDSISYLTDLISHIYYNGYVLDKLIVDNEYKIINFKVIEHRKLYKQCIDGNMENIGECTCNDILGELKELEGKQWVLDKFVTPPKD